MCGLEWLFLLNATHAQQKHKSVSEILFFLNYHTLRSNILRTSRKKYFPWTFLSFWGVRVELPTLSRLKVLNIYLNHLYTPFSLLKETRIRSIYNYEIYLWKNSVNHSHYLTTWHLKKNKTVDFAIFITISLITYADAQQLFKLNEDTQQGKWNIDERRRV